MPDITLKSAFTWIFSGIIQNGAIWILGLVFAAVFWLGLFGSLWLFDRHHVMKAPKKKYFFVGISLIVGIVFGVTLIFCGMMTSVARHLNRQVEDMRTAAVGRENRGLIAGILCIAKINSLEDTNVVYNEPTSQGLYSSPQNKTIETGSDFCVVVRISNQGAASSLWNYKAYIVLPGGKEIDASIPSLKIPKSSNVIPTLFGPYKCAKENFLLDALSFSPMESGASGNYWLLIHVNGITEVPSGTHFIISFTDVFVRETRIDYIWISNP